MTQPWAGVGRVRRAPKLETFVIEDQAMADLLGSAAEWLTVTARFEENENE
jgi:hypothetical protein